MRLHRKSLDSLVFKNPKLWLVWCYCLIRAGHKETRFQFNGKVEVLKPGQFITGRFEGARDCNLKPSTFWEQLLKLKKLGCIDIISDNKKSVITVINWSLYQHPEESFRQQTQHQSDTNNNVIIIELGFAIIKQVKNKASAYSMLNKFKTQMGDDKLKAVLSDCNMRGLSFENESNLAAYLAACLKNQGGKAFLTDKLRELKSDIEEGWQ